MTIIERMEPQPTLVSDHGLYEWGTLRFYHGATDELARQCPIGFPHKFVLAFPFDRKFFCVAVRVRQDLDGVWRWYSEWEEVQ